MAATFDQQAYDEHVRALHERKEADGLTDAQVEREAQRNRRFYNYVTCCGQKLYVPDFTNTCPTCEADYNWAGQRLAARSQWGEETGEHPADIARIR